MRPAPRKYLDRDRTQVNPEWLTWRQEAIDEYEVTTSLFLYGNGGEGTYFPEREGKAIPDDGAWILVIEEPMTVLRSRFRIPLLSMWRARPHELNSGAIKIREGISVYPKQAVIQTPGGDVHLWAHEYVMATNPLALITDPDATINTLGGDAVIDPEALFYLQSRGIPHADAVLLLFEQIKGQDYAYVTFPEEITELLRGVGVPLWRHIGENPRVA